MKKFESELWCDKNKIGKHDHFIYYFPYIYKTFPLE